MTELTIGELSLTLTRKPIKNLHIKVLPPHGLVQISAPMGMSESTIRAAVAARIPWIRQHQRQFAQQPRQSERQMVSGESHYLWGQSYRLELIERVGAHQVVVGRGNRLQLYVNPATTQLNKQRALERYYRDELKCRVSALLAKWESSVEGPLPVWGIKKMKTKWGSCNAQTRRIWLNLELAKKPPQCLEYILVHELVHLSERHHNERFRAILDRLMPDWRERRDLLNSTPLAHSEWRY